MPTIPLVDAPLPNGNAGTGNVRVNPNMLDGVFQAQSRIGQAVSGIGEQGVDLATRVKQATDTAYVIGAQTKLETTTQDFKAWTLNHPDTSTWNDELKARLQATTEDVQKGAGNLGNAAKLHLTTQVDGWQKRTAAQSNIWATEQNIHNAAGVGDEALALATANSSLEDAQHVVSANVAAGVWSAAVGQAKLKRVSDGIVKNQANALILNDPTHASEQIRDKANFPTLNDTQRESLWREAERTRNRVQTENLDRIYRQHQAGIVLDPAEVEKSVEAGDISARGAQAYNGYVAREQKAAMTADKAAITARVKADAQELTNDIHDYDAATDTTGQTYADIKQRALGLPMEYSDKLLRRLDDQKKKGTADASDSGMKVIAQMHADGIFGDASGKSDDKVRARERVYDLQESLISWRKEHPAATHEDERKFIQGEVYPWVVNHVTGLLENAKAPKAVSTAPAGAAFYSKSTGKWYDADKKEIK